MAGHKRQTLHNLLHHKSMNNLINFKISEIENLEELEIVGGELKGA